MYKINKKVYEIQKMIKSLKNVRKFLINVYEFQNLFKVQKIFMYSKNICESKKYSWIKKLLVNSKIVRHCQKYSWVCKNIDEFKKLFSKSKKLENLHVFKTCFWIEEMFENFAYVPAHKVYVLGRYPATHAANRNHRDVGQPRLGMRKTWPAQRAGGHRNDQLFEYRVNFSLYIPPYIQIMLTMY